jgi:hypothetical protein
VEPAPEYVHWLFAVGFLVLGLCLLAEAIAGRDVYARRAWRAYLWPGFLFGMGLGMWPVMTFFTSSTIHMLAHGAWAQAMLLTGAVELGLARGKLRSPYWMLVTAVGLAVSGAALLVHEENGWLYSRSAFLHHLLGWFAVGAAVFPAGRAFRPRSPVFRAGFALTLIAVAVLLFAHRDAAEIFGHFGGTVAGR